MVHDKPITENSGGAHATGTAPYISWKLLIIPLLGSGRSFALLGARAQILSRERWKRILLLIMILGTVCAR